MNVLLLAAGYGKRLRQLTKSTPKCLIKVDEETMLDFWIKKINDINFDKIYINTHYLHEQVYTQLKKYKNIDIKILYEKKLLGTSGTIFKNLNYFKDNDLLVIHCDNFTNFDISKLIEVNKMKPKKCIMTMLTFDTNKPKDSGIVIKNSENILENYFEKKNGNYGNEANAAIYILSRKFFEDKKYIVFYNSFNFAKEVIPNLIGEVYVYKTDDFFIDIGDQESLKIARNRASSLK